MSNDNSNFLLVIVIILLCFAGCDSCRGCRANVRELWPQCAPCEACP
jgi:hypothetical protein